MNILPIEEYRYTDPEALGVDNVSITYVNDGDCVNDEPQELKISTANNGTARFIILETNRWSISDTEDIAQVIQDFKMRAGIR